MEKVNGSQAASQDSDFSDFDITKINTLNEAFEAIKAKYGILCHKKERPWYECCLNLGESDQDLFLVLHYKRPFKNNAKREDLYLFDEEDDSSENYVAKISFLHKNKKTEASGDYLNLRMFGQAYPKFRQFRNFLFALQEKLGYSPIETPYANKGKKFTPKVRQH